MAPKPQKLPKGPRPVAQNRRARHDFDVLETLECGIALKGSEVKSIRDGKLQLRDAYARVDGREVWLHGVHVSPYAMATGFGSHDPERVRKLLLHRREIASLIGKVREKGQTLVPTRLYFKDGKVKVELALARGKEKGDKRRDIAEREAKRQMERVLKSRR